ncbi:EcoKI restriction-modification system protein HsdS [Planctomycetes bacterium CA13]|uniref:EcoKI restriction-modification system protein HsdS n=1 Tax=Novipirellula herctigrandis TaxID=2527986 RepID=A0A5C5ZC81_9BACT|nr:EcoKI restriction-modification system protein HsdS [Planctomycetes bacterium CA13]
MGVKSGFQQTEAGLIPLDWTISFVGEEFDIKLGKMLDAEKNEGVPKPYIGNRAVQWNKIDIGELPTVPLTSADLKRFRLEKGDLLVCEGGDVGRAAIWDAPIEECYYQKALHRLRPLRGFEVRLMVALLWQWSRRGVLANFVTQTSIAHLPREKFIEIPMPIPPPAEQRAIAEALGDVDALLGVLDRMLTKKRDLKQAAMQQLLTGQTRLPGFKGEWEEKTLQEICEFTNGKPLEGEVKADGRFNLITLDSIGIDGQLKKEHKRTDHCDSSLDAGDIVAVLSDLAHGNLLGLCDVIPVSNAYVLNQRMGRLRLSVEGDSRYVRLQINRRQSHFKKRGQGTSQRHIYRRDFDALEIPFPDPQEQTAIAEVLSDMDAEITVLERRREKTSMLKQGMMQELLSGKTRLIQPEACHA